MSVKKISTLALLTTIIYVGRIFFQFLPNVQPMTAILIMITFVYGFSEGCIVAVLSILMTNINLGMGIWTLAQIVSYIIIILFSHLYRPFYQIMPLWVTVLFVGFTGILYGFFISLLQAPFFGFNIFIPYYLSGIAFDLFHAVGNGIFYIILAPYLIPLINKHKFNRRL